MRTVNAFAQFKYDAISRFPRPRDSSAPTDNGGVHGTMGATDATV